MTGRYVRHDGQEITGRVWDPDTQYRYRQALADWPVSLPRRSQPYDQSWFSYIGDDLVWDFDRAHVIDWAARLVNADGSSMAETSRARAASAVRSFYAHCEVQLGASSWGLPARVHLVGAARPVPRKALDPAEMDALRTAADRYRGPHAERGRLVVYLTLVGLRPGQTTGLWLGHISRTDQRGAMWRLPAKNNSSSAVAPWTKVHPEVVWAIDEYLAVRTHRAPASTETTGPLLVSYRGNSFDRPTITKVIRTVAATHPALEELAPGLLPDAVAHSPSPFA
ncbi:hypothetical protein [Streptomyces sp. NPDC088739]|uniref:hypothetical protein n=1 Tax=Streptomyces sp. NPDC088739 TaxID=3365882 RepID=UPI00382DB767